MSSKKKGSWMQSTKKTSRTMPMEEPGQPSEVNGIMPTSSNTASQASKVIQGVKTRKIVDL